MIGLCSTVNWHLQPEQHYSVRGFYQLVKWSVVLYSKAPSQWVKVLKERECETQVPFSHFYPVRRRLAVQNDAFPTLSICHSCLWRGKPCDASRQAGRNKGAFLACSSPSSQIIYCARNEKSDKIRQKEIGKIIKEKTYELRHPVLKWSLLSKNLGLPVILFKIVKFNLNLCQSIMNLAQSWTWTWYDIESGSLHCWWIDVGLETEIC